MKTKEIISTLALCQVIGACSAEQLPPGASVLVTPQSKTIRINTEQLPVDNTCSTSNGIAYQDVPILISVADAQGSPLGSVDVTVYSDYAGNTYTGLDVLRVYADRNSNGVIDHPAELVTGSDDGVYQTKTNKYDGTTRLMVRMNLNCAYHGELVVFAAASSANASFAVEYVQDATIDGESVEGIATGADTYPPFPDHFSGGQGR